MPANENVIPCAVFAFNRPDKLERVLAALKTQDIDRLIVFVDGPRDDADIELVEQCRAIARGVDWVDKELHFGEQNRGLPGLNDNVGTVMNVYKSAVFVEDDCLPMPGFYSFMRRALSHYEQRKKVFSIGAYQPIQQNYFKNCPYSLVSTARFLCWGWATWQDRWELITPYLSRYRELFDGLTNVPDIAGHDLAIMARSSDSWDIRVAVSMLWLKQVQLIPTKGLVQNIGVASGTHKKAGRSKRSVQHLANRNVYEHSLEDIVWLENVELNSDYAERLKQFVSNAGPWRRSWHRVKDRVRQTPFLLGPSRWLRRLID